MRQVCYISNHHDKCPDPEILTRIVKIQFDHTGTKIDRYLPDWINCCKELKELSFESSRIVSLPTNFPHKLTILRLNGNRIMSFPKSLPPTLITLDLSFNLIEDISTILPPDLESLYLGHNNINKINVTFPSRLKILNLSHNNRLSELQDISHLSCLEDLHLNTNWRLRDREMIFPQGLKILDLQSVIVKNVSFPSSVVELDISFWKLNGEDVSHFVFPPSLERIDISDNDITDFPLNLPLTLKFINISNNGMTGFPFEIMDYVDIEIYSRRWSTCRHPSLHRFRNRRRQHETTELTNIDPKIKQSVLNLLKATRDIETDSFHGTMWNVSSNIPPDGHTILYTTIRELYM